MFKVNQAVVHPIHGVGNVVAIEPRNFLGIREEDHYIMAFPSTLGTVSIPVNNAPMIGLRPIADAVLLAEVISILDNAGALIAEKDMRTALRHDHLIARIQSGDPREVARVYKGLASGKSPSVKEKTLMDTAESLLAGELAHSNTVARSIPEALTFLRHTVGIPEGVLQDDID